MNSYIGKVCPFCKTEFKENDEIVVCSSCDMPHHKECWIENQGCTTFGCMGTIKGADGSPNSVTATEISYDNITHTNKVFCTKCGAENSTNFSFCVKCGNSLNSTSVSSVYNQQTTYAQNNYTTANISIDEDLAALVGTNQQYYIPKFLELKSQNKKTTWNWAAFFFTPYWFMYRKMYVYGFLAFYVALLINLINITIFTFLSLGGYVAIALYADYIYMKKLEDYANHAKNIAEPHKAQYIQKNGGVDSTALIFSIIGWVALICIIVGV